MTAVAAAARRLAPLLVAAVVTLLAVASMRLLPPSYRGTGVGMVFLGATYLLVWRRGDRGGRARGWRSAVSSPGERPTQAPASRAVGWARPPRW